MGATRDAPRGAGEASTLTGARSSPSPSANLAGRRGSVSAPIEWATFVESSRTIAPPLRTHGAIVFALLAQSELPEGVLLYGLLAVAVLFLAMTFWWLTVRVIPNDKVGVVEKLWSRQGSVT